MAEILCSTGALIGRPNGRDYRLLEQFSKQLNCDGFEFMIYSSWYDEIEDVISFLRYLKLYIPVVHCEKKIGESISIGGDERFNSALENFELNCRVAKEIGSEKLVLHLWDGIPSDGNFDNNLKMYPKLVEIALRYNQTLLVENVVCNHKDPMTRCLELMNKYNDVKFVFDTKMAAFHQQIELLYSPDYAPYAKQIRHFHVNDYGGGFMDWANLRTLPVGRGNIDFNRFFEYIKSIGYNGTFTLESTAFDSNGIVDIEMLNNQISQVRNLIKL